MYSIYSHILISSIINMGCRRYYGKQGDDELNKLRNTDWEAEFLCVGVDQRYKRFWEITIKEFIGGYQQYRKERETGL